MATIREGDNRRRACENWESPRDSTYAPRSAAAVVHNRAIEHAKEVIMEGWRRLQMAMFH